MFFHEARWPALMNVFDHRTVFLARLRKTARSREVWNVPWKVDSESTRKTGFSNFVGWKFHRLISSARLICAEMKFKSAIN